MEDLEKYQYSNEFHLAIQLKSWMAINPSIGCLWNCAYCIQHKDTFFNNLGPGKIKKIYSPKETISELLKNSRITSKTPLTFYNFSDPFLPHNTKDLKTILLELDNKKFQNIVGFITKTLPDIETLEVIAGLNYLRPLVLVSYAGYQNKQLESAPIGQRINLLEELKKRGIPTLQYLRPIAREWLETDHFKKTRDSVKGLIDGVVMSGIRITPEIAKNIQSRGLQVPKVNNYLNKFFPKEIQEEIIEAYRDISPVYRYTSCGVSAIFGLPDYNAHLGFFRETQNSQFYQCPLPCNNKQKGICSSCKNPSQSEVRGLLNKIGLEETKFKIKPSGMISIDRETNKEDLTFLRHNTLAHVDYENHTHHIDQVGGMEINQK